MKSRLFALCVLIGSAGLVPCSAQIIAEYHPGVPQVTAFPNGMRLDGQTFTAGATGSFGLVSIWAQSVGVSTPSITFQLRSVTAGLPDSTILGSVSIAGSALTSSLRELTADFSGQNIAVVSGASYAITISSPAFIALGGDVNNGYAFGQQVTSSNNGASFVPFPPPRDLYFSASLAATPVPEPSTTALAGVTVLLAIVGLSRFKKRVAATTVR